MRGIRISEMATRNTANLPVRPETCTEFQLYEKRAIDYTERKLVRMVAKTSDPAQKLTLCALIDDYRTGHVAIAWRAGKPVFVRVTKEA